MADAPTGPRYCTACGAWPAMETPQGLRCHLCECRDYAASHPVPLRQKPAKSSFLQENDRKTTHIPHPDRFFPCG